MNFQKKYLQKIMVFKRNNKSLEYPGFSMGIYTPQPCL